jgi:ABC-type phosphate transport system substrate-binding protein
MRSVWLRSGLVFVFAAAVLTVADDSSAATCDPDPHATRASGFVVVVNDQNTVGVMSRAQVARYFLKKISRWEGGAVAMPVDLPVGSPVREAFSRRILAKSVTSVKAYWQQQIFSGRDVPPPEKPSDDAVLEFVQMHPAAIAYVSPNVTLPRGVRMLDVAD